MAVTELNNPSSLRIRLSLGQEDGKDKRRTKSYSHLKPDAPAQDVYDVGVALMTLQQYPTLEISKIDNTVIAE